MNEDNVVTFRQPDEIDDALTEVLRAGARRLLAQAVDAEVTAFLAEHSALKLTAASELFVMAMRRNG